MSLSFFSEYNSSTPDALNDLLCCKGRCPKLLSCGHMCPKICHTGDCAKAELCSELTKVKCKCGRKKKVIKHKSLGKSFYF